MAFTMRDFLHGLAVGAQQASQTYMQYYQYREQMELERRKVAVEEQKAASYDKYMGAQSEYLGAETERTKVITEGEKQKLPLELYRMEMENSASQIDLRMKNLNMTALNQAGGAEYLRRSLIQELDARDATIQQALAAAADSLQGVELKKFQQEYAQFQYDNDRLRILAYAGLDPQTQMGLTKMLDEGKFNSTGEFINAIIASGGRNIPPDLAQAMLGVQSYEAQMSIQLDNSLAEWKNNFVTSIFGEGAEKLRKEWGIKTLQDAEALADTYMENVKSAPFYQQMQVFRGITDQLATGFSKENYTYMPVTPTVDKSALPPAPTAPDYSGMTPDERVRAQWENSPANMMLNRLYDRVNVPLKQPYLLNQY